MLSTHVHYTVSVSVSVLLLYFTVNIFLSALLRLFLPGGGSKIWEFLFRLHDLRILVHIVE